MSFLKKTVLKESGLASFLKWGLLGVLMGGIGGVLGALFAHALEFAVEFRGENSWLIYLLPLGGVMTVGLYRLFRMQKNRGTNEIMDAVLGSKPLKGLIAPLIFLATAIAQLFGASSGREGAALQIGGSVASSLSKLFRLKDSERNILVMCGMSAVFAGLFGTPLTAAVFVIEFLSVGTLFLSAILPCFVASFLAAYISSLMGVHAEGVLLGKIFEFTPESVVQLVVFAVAVAILSFVMCKSIHTAEHMFAKWFKNTYIRAVVGALVLLVLTLIVGDQRYNGAGMSMVLTAVEGQADWYDFILKLLFTALSLAAGFKGGEIVPTFCIGATFGCFLGEVIGMNPAFTGALGLVALFCAVTNSPLASIILSMEMFGSENLYAFVLVCVLVFALSGDGGLYSAQGKSFSKKTLIQIPSKN